MSRIARTPVRSIRSADVKPKTADSVLNKHAAEAHAMATGQNPAHRAWEYLGRSFDLTTVEGTRAYEEHRNQRYAEAHETLATVFRDIRDNLEEIDELAKSLLVDLAGDDERGQEVHDLARIVRAAFCIRGVLPAPNTKAVSR